MIERTTFHDLVGDLDYPMLIVTARAGEGGERSGCLVGFATQCSIEPPRFVAFVSKQNHTYGVARESPVLVVHLLSAEHRDLATLFGSRTGDDTDKFSLCRWHAGPAGVPVLDECDTWFAGRVVDALDGGDHVGFVLEPTEAERGRAVRQLSFQAVKDMPTGHGA